MADIIDFQKARQAKQQERLNKIKKDLALELAGLDYDMEKELTRYVIPSNSEYYKLSKEDDVNERDEVTTILLTALEILLKLNMHHAANDVENIVTRLKNNSY